MNTLHFVDLDGFLGAIRVRGAKSPARWRLSGLLYGEWSSKAFELKEAALDSILVDIEVDVRGFVLCMQRVDLFGTAVARLALELYGAGAPFADVRCDVPIEWTTNAAGERYDIYTDEIPAHHSRPVHAYTPRELTDMRRALEIATFRSLGLPEGEIRTWQERRRLVSLDKDETS